VAFNSKAKGPQSWTVGQLSAFYTNNRSELLAHANRILKDSTKAEEITQESFVKFMLAAPELQSEAHANSYLHRAIENLCIDHFRSENRRPNLVVLDEVVAEVEATWQADGDHSAALSVAEDAAIIRQALSLLSPAERAALVMWEMEGRSTQEIAAELGIKESAVRHTVSRARASLRKVLATLVIDEERGLTALDLLGSTYKKASEVAKKSGKVAMSLILVIAAFFGFNSLTGSESGTTPSLTSKSSPSAPSDSTESTVAGSDSTAVAADAPQSVSIFGSTSVRAVAAGFTAALKSANSMLDSIQAQLAKFDWPGVNMDGMPKGFSVNDGKDLIGSGDLVNFGGQNSSTSVFVSDSELLSLSLSQNITMADSNPSVTISPTARINGAWANLNIKNTITSASTRADGSRLLIVTLVVDQNAPILGPASGLPDSGASMSAAPEFLTAKIHLSADGSQVLGEALQVLSANLLSKVGA